MKTISKKFQAKNFWLVVLIIFSALFGTAFAVDKPQFSLGDKLSVFSDKAYRKNGGRYFEAVGNVVIISQKDTVYGELASLDQDTQMVRIEGNVRFITKDMTLYGSHVEYNLVTGAAAIKNARILAADFNIVANKLQRLSEEVYLAEEAEFTTCKDCAESWSIYGKEIKLSVGKMVQIKNGIAKVKGINVLYIPYIVLPVQTQRKTGLLFPRISSRPNEGLSLEQPFFWAIDPSKDMTLSPTFWAKRGYGGDFQYRQRFEQLDWLEVNSRLLNDKIYEPGKTSQTVSGEEFFRYFTEMEIHQQWNSNIRSHAHFTGARDLEIIRDHPMFTEPRTLGSDMGLRANFDWRKDYFSVGAEAEYLRNQLFNDPLEFDRKYVQTMPRLNFSTVPYSIFQTDKFMLQHLTVGLDSSFTRFRQVDSEEVGDVLRNADRFSVQPYLMWNFFTWGPVSFKSRYAWDQQLYRFKDDEQPAYGKNAALMRTEISFSMDKIYGLAYEEKIPIKYIPEKELEDLREKKEQGLTPLKATEKENRLVGEIPSFESELTKENITQVKNSYRHSQEYKFIHHYIPSENEYGNRSFDNQIKSTNLGWFDFEDAIRSREFQFGTNVTRIIIPPQNTAEFQWNNTLVRKTPKTFNYLEDYKFLRDNFTYTRIGYFNVSQGYLLGNKTNLDFRENLTRLSVLTGYTTGRWSMDLAEYYFHYNNRNITTLSFSRRFEYLNFFGSYNYNSFPDAVLNSAAVGGQVRPMDSLGLAYMKEIDIVSNVSTRTVYALDIMPDNNCWILNLSYTERTTDSRFSFNFMFNFGDEGFARFRNNYFAAQRL